jgi:hypothetical protein
MKKETYVLDVQLTREALMGMVEELDPWGAPLSASSRAYLRALLVQIIDQMDPKRDTRVKVGPWQIAMLAADLVDQCNAQPKFALIAAMETLAPEKAQNEKFRAFIERTYSRLRAGQNPARPQLLPIPPEVLAFAREKLPS